MCGIVGILRVGDRPLPSRDVLRRMMASIEYRGPDDSGEFFDADVQLGVVRLSIVDPKGGSQPIAGCTDNTVVVYNGETYNAHSLRQRLTRDGHRFRTQCDAEVVPHLLEEHGSDFATAMRGMFALAAWNRSERTLTLARDRMGIKPLYISQTPDYLLFASEVKAIIASGLVKPAIDPESLDDLFSLSYPCPPRTMFKGIRELLPAHVAEARAGRQELTQSRYWESPVPPRGEHPRISRDEAAEELRSLLRLRVYDHTFADTPVAAYLSGGLDSSAICGLMRDVSGDPPNTFSISFSSAAHDEYQQAQEVATYLGSPNSVLKCDESTSWGLERMVWHTELPLQFPLALPMISLARLARSEGFPVILTGEGADELMGGYDCFRGDKMRRMLDRPGLRFLRPAVYQQLYKWMKMPDGAVETIIENQAGSDRIKQSYGGIYPPWFDVWTTIGVDRSRLLGGAGRAVRDVWEAPDGFAELLPSNLQELHPLDAGIVLEQRTRLPAWILLIGDRASMAEGVEARVPFLDQDVVEFVASLPPSYKMNRLQEKSILRRAVENFLPESAAQRKKRPFYTPIREWFFSDDRPEFVSDMLSTDSLRSSGLFDPQLVASYLREVRVVPEHSLLKNRLEWTLALILQTQILHQQFVVDSCSKPPPPRVVA